MTFIIKPGDPVYYPAISNSIFETNNCNYAKDVLQIKKPSVYFMEDGKLKEDHPNPSIFPATKEWFEKLKITFPNLHNPESFSKLQKKALVTEIINKFGFCHVAREDNFKNLITNVIKQVDQLGHYDYPINPFTLKRVKSLEEYLMIPTISPEIYKHCIEVTEYKPELEVKFGYSLWFDNEGEIEAFLMARKNDKHASYKYVGLKLHKD